MLLAVLKENPITFLPRLLRQSRPVVVWVMWLGVVNMASLAFLSWPEGRRTAIAMAVAFGLMVTLYAVNGFNRLLGLPHIVAWGPLLVLMIPRLGDLPAGDAVTVWAWALVVTNGISVVIDVVDVGRYIAGDRE